MLNNSFNTYIYVIFKLNIVYIKTKVKALPLFELVRPKMCLAVRTHSDRFCGTYCSRAGLNDRAGRELL